MPFYKELAQIKNEKGLDINLIAVFPNTKAEVNKYVEQHQLNLNAVAEVNLDAINVPATPAIVLVDSAGRISNYWIGKLSKDGEKEIIKTLGL